MKSRGLVLAVCLLSVVYAPRSSAQIPAIAFQGVLQNPSGSPKADGTYNVTFQLYTTLTGGSAVWTESKSITVSGGRGLFATSLGSVSALPAFNHPYWLAITVAPDAPMAPRLPLLSAAYARNSLDLQLPWETSISASAPALSVTNTGGGTALTGVHQAADAGPAIIGTTTSTAGSAIGIEGIVDPTNPGGMSAAIRGANHGTSDLGIGVYGRQDGSGWGVYGYTPSGLGVYGSADSGVGVEGTSSSNHGVYGLHQSASGTLAGVQGETQSNDAGAVGVEGAVNSTSPGGMSAAVRGVNNGTGSLGIGVYGTQSGSGWGVSGYTPSGLGVYGTADSGVGVKGTSYSNYGVYGWHLNATGTQAGVHGQTESNDAGAAGVRGVLDSSSPGQNSAGVIGSTSSYGPFVYGVLGTTVSAVHSAGVHGENTSGLTFGAGTEGWNTTGYGVYGITGSGKAVYGEASAVLGSKGIGVEGVTQDGIAIHGTLFNYNGTPTGKAGVFDGDVEVHGKLTKTTGSFKIDHPLDPANKYLSHSFVESPDMMNIYNGIATTDANGEATITLPNWFEALNEDYRYQLTCIGQFAQAIVSQEILHNQFSIKTDKPDVKVSWQVTGIRHDAYADAHRIPVEEMKTPEERGKYLHPIEFGQPVTATIGYRERPKDELPVR